jgi:hypothetical protein
MSADATRQLVLRQQRGIENHSSRSRFAVRVALTKHEPVCPSDTAGDSCGGNPGRGIELCCSIANAGSFVSRVNPAMVGLMHRFNLSTCRLEGKPEMRHG